MGDNRQIQHCRRIIGLGFERGAKVADGFIGAAALTSADTAESVERFGVLWTETKGVLESFFRGSEFIDA